MNTSFSNSKPLLWVLPIGLVLVATYYSIVSAFRVDSEAIDLALRANLARALCAAAAGIAFAVGGAVFNTTATAFRHVSVFIALVLGSLVFLIITAFAWSVAVAATVALAVAVLSFLLSRRLDKVTSSANLVLAAVLSLMFALSIVCFAFASALGDKSGSVVLWLMGDISRATAYPWVLSCSAVALTALVIVGWQRQAFASLMVGLGVGVAGALVFVAWLAPHIAKPFARSERSYVFLSAVIGGGMLVIADSVSRLLIGGYAPPLLIPVTIVSMPVLLWFNRKRLNYSLSPSSFRSYIEALLILLAILVSIPVIIHLSEYAQRLA